MVISTQPTPGDYENKTYVRLSHRTAKRIFFAFGEERDANCWMTRPTVPLPVRSHAAVITSADNYNLVGGFSSGSAIENNDRYDRRKESWICDTNLPMPVGSPVVCENLLVTGDNTALTTEWSPETNSWRSRCPAPRTFSGHHASESGKAYIFGEDVYSYDKKKDCWSFVTKNVNWTPHGVSAAVGDKIFVTTESEGLVMFDPKKESFSGHMLLEFRKGSSVSCVHDRHFLMTGGHSDTLSGSVSRIDIETRTAHALEDITPGAYASGGGHALMSGVARNNSFSEYSCAFSMQEYRSPVLLEDVGNHAILAVAVDKDLNVVDRGLFRYGIRSDMIFFTIHLKRGVESKMRWPNCERMDGESFTVRDIVPQGSIVGIAHGDGPIREYSHELLDRFGTLNVSFKPGETYRFSLVSGGDKRISLEAKPWDSARTQRDSQGS